MPGSCARRDDAFVCACEAVAQDDLVGELRRYRLASRADIADVDAAS